jgi:glycogen(starch) synthase
MKVLVLSNLYPPHFMGGYEIACHDVMERLRARGHEVVVVTSTFQREGVRDAASKGYVFRVLPWRFRVSAEKGWGVHYFLEELRAHDVLRRMLRFVRPDVVSVWNLAYVPSALLLTAVRGGVPVVLSVFDCWPLEVRSNDWWFVRWQCNGSSHGKRVLKNGSRAIIDRLAPTRWEPQRVAFAQFFSEFLHRRHERNGCSFPKSRLIYHGIDLEQFTYAKHAQSPSVRRLLYIGQVDAHKGVHVAVDALGILMRNYQHQDLELSIVGPTNSTAYMARLHAQADRLRLAERIRFVPLKQRCDIPAVMRDHDVLLFPSIWDEPFGITILEAMASGLPVVATGTGGSGEIVRHEDTGLIAAPGDAQGLAEQIHRLKGSASLARLLRDRARAYVESDFTIERTVHQFESLLHEATA